MKRLKTWKQMNELHAATYLSAADKSHQRGEERSTEFKKAFYKKILEDGLKFEDFRFTESDNEDGVDFEHILYPDDIYGTVYIQEDLGRGAEYGLRDISIIELGFEEFLGEQSDPVYKMAYNTFHELFEKPENEEEIIKYLDI